MEEILRTILYEWQERKLPKIIKREIKIEAEGQTPLRKATVVTGFRRSGKTYLLFSLIKKLLSFYSRQQVIYINFEDERLPQTTGILSNLLPTIQSTFGKKPQFLFLDEIQNIPSWSKWLRRILDTEAIKIFVTGSSSKMSSFELPTELRGRAWEIKVFPLSLSEFFQFKEISFDWDKFDSLAEEKAKFYYVFDEFLTYGSLPEIVFTPEEKKQELLQGYFNTVVRKEIMERFTIKNEEALKAILKLLLNFTYLTVSKLYNNLKSLGLSVGKTTINEYLSYIESSYFLKQVYIYSPSAVNQLQYPRKIYFVDNGFITTLSTKFSKNYGRLFENFIFWVLAKQFEEIFYFRDRKEKEVDFVLREGEKTKALYQVCYDISDFETSEREIRNLILAGKRLSCNNLILFTLRKGEALSKHKEVKIIGADFLLRENILNLLS